MPTKVAVVAVLVIAGFVITGAILAMWSRLMPLRCSRTMLGEILIRHLMRGMGNSSLTVTSVASRNGPGFKITKLGNTGRSAFAITEMPGGNTVKERAELRETIEIAEALADQFELGDDLICRRNGLFRIRILD